MDSLIVIGQHMTITKQTKQAQLPISGNENFITVDQAFSERVARAMAHSNNCILMALVTTPSLSGELIDKAVQYNDDAGHIIATSKPTD